MRAQITAFIIIGTLVLLILAVVLQLSSFQVKPIEEEIQVPPDIRQVYDQVTSCLYDISKEAITRAGMQGGYVYVPDKIIHEPRSFLALDSFFKVPFWFYNEDRTPSAGDVERDIALFVQDKIARCLPENTQMVSNATPIVMLADKEVISKVKWPLRITIGDRTIYYEDFVTRLDVPLKQMLSMASKAAHTTFFENLTLEVISGDKEIPTDGMEFSCGQKKWDLETVRNNLQQDMNYNLLFVRVKNTDYLPFEAPEKQYQIARQQGKIIQQKLVDDVDFEWPNTPSDIYEHEKMFLDLGLPATDYKMFFIHRPEWPIEFNGKPKDGSKLVSNQMKGAGKYLKWMCINQWHFTYDTTYPIMGVVKDDKAFNGEGFSFQYVFPVIIRDNTAIARDEGLTMFEPEISVDFCSSIGSQVVDVRAMGFQGDVIATELADANISYECITQTCNLGQTAYDGGIVRLRTALPSGCGNPYIIAEHAGYLPAVAQASSDIVDLYLTKIVNLNYSVEKIPYYKDTQTIGVAEPLLNEKAIIRIAINGTDNEQYKEFPSNDTLYLVDGTELYNIDVYLYDKWGKIIGSYSDTQELTPSGETMVIPVLQFIPVPTTAEEEAAMIDVSVPVLVAFT